MDPLSTRLRFGPFIFDPARGHLERDGIFVALQSQPARVLGLLVSRPGELVTRDELRREIWGGTWVDFNQGLNYCIRQIRLALDDDAKRPIYVRTLAHRGYQFVAAVEPLLPAAAKPAQGKSRRRWSIAGTRTAGVFAALIFGIVAGLMTAQAVVEEVGRSREARAIAEHLTPLHLVRGTWQHHLRPLFSPAVPTSAAR